MIVKFLIEGLSKFWRRHSDRRTSAHAQNNHRVQFEFLPMTASADASFSWCRKFQRLSERLHTNRERGVEDASVFNSLGAWNHQSTLNTESENRDDLTLVIALCPHSRARTRLHRRCAPVWSNNNC